MDSLTRQNIDALIVELKNAGTDASDPVSKLMTVTLLHQLQKIRDEIDALPQRMVERLCAGLVPADKINAVPSLALVRPSMKIRRDMAPHTIADGCYFTFKADARQSLSYYPLFKTLLLPFSKSYLMTPYGLRSKDSYTPIQGGKNGKVWLGMEIAGEIESLENASFLIKGTDGVLPKKITLESSSSELMFTCADNIGSLTMMEPFDSRQMTPGALPAVAHWQSILSQSEHGRLVYITDTVTDRDLFKCKAYPKSFRQSLESTDLDMFAENTLWILFDFGDEYHVPESIEIIPGVVPVVNVSVNTVTLTQSAPIAKLTKNDGAYFLSVVETPLSLQKQGFDANEEGFVIRDFDSHSYNPGTLYRDVRNLYNHFIDDYYAFIEYNGLKDGELVRSMRETVNRIGKSVTAESERQNRFDEGVYAMRNIKLIGQTAPVKVTYLTTMGSKGNMPKSGMMMENKKDVALEKDVAVVMSATGGADRATADQMYELLRYYTLTSDRLYTKMDVDAFLRLHIVKAFGNEEARRISYTISIHGAAGSRKLQRGLYIDISFKDNKNYQKAVSMAWDRMLHQEISDKSCIAMPVIIGLKLSE